MNCLAKRKKEEKIKSEAINNAVEYMILAFVQYLGDKRGWKQNSLCEAIKYCFSHAEAIAEKYTTLEEAREDVWETYGIKFENGSFYVEKREGL